MGSMMRRMSSEKSVTECINFTSNAAKKQDGILMDEFYKVSTYSGIFFVALIGVSWAISLLEKSPE